MWITIIRSPGIIGGLIILALIIIWGIAYSIRDVVNRGAYIPTIVGIILISIGIIFGSIINIITTIFGVWLITTQSKNPIQRVRTNICAILTISGIILCLIGGFLLLYDINGFISCFAIFQTIWIGLNEFLYNLIYIITIILPIIAGLKLIVFGQRQKKWKYKF